MFSITSRLPHYSRYLTHFLHILLPSKKPSMKRKLKVTQRLCPGAHMVYIFSTLANGYFGAW